MGWWKSRSEAEERAHRMRAKAMQDVVWEEQRAMKVGESMRKRDRMMRSVGDMSRRLKRKGL